MLPAEYKDANEFLISDRTAFEEWINQGLEAFKEKVREADTAAREEFENESAYSDLATFLQTLKKSREGKAIPTGFLQLDRLLDA